LEAAVRANQKMVFLAWGKFAQTLVKKLPLGPDHLVLEAAHPSPLSAHKGFFGSKPFSKANAHLAEPIDWSV
jgi:uracil-DNA glycosylase